MTRTIEVDGRVLAVDETGAGSPVLLLHGFPETRLAWRSVVPLLEDGHRVVSVDLPGYGESDPPDGDDPAAYAKRATATRLVRMMAELGHDRFAVVGHDRGGLVAFRMALDHPDRVSHLTVLDVIPTVDNWEALRGVGGVFAFHLYLLATPPDLAERMVGADPDAFFGHFLDAWVTVEGAVPPEVRRVYLDGLRDPARIHAVCQDYRASAFVDGEHDAADREAGRRLTMPTLVQWQDPGDLPLPFDPAQVWASWAEDLTTGVLPCGHFLPEERPEEVAHAVRRLLAR